MHMPEQANFEILEHTADAGIVAHGRTLAEAFAHAAEGMYALMVDLKDVRERDAREINVRAPDLPGLLTAWLLELLFLTETEGLVFRRFEVETTGTSLRGRAYGEPLDPEQHEPGGDIKGVTRHMLEVAPDNDGYRVRVLFDM